MYNCGARFVYLTRSLFPRQARRAAASNFANKTRKQQCDVTTTIFFIGLWHHANRILCDIIFFCCFSSLLVRPPVSQQTAKHCGGCSPPFPVSIGASLPLTNFPLPLSAFCAAVRPLFGKPPSIAMLLEFGLGRGGQHMCWREESQGSSPLPYLNRKITFLYTNTKRPTPRIQFHLRYLASYCCTFSRKKIPSLGKDNKATKNRLCSTTCGKDSKRIFKVKYPKPPKKTF